MCMQASVCCVLHCGDNVPRPSVQPHRICIYNRRMYNDWAQDTGAAYQRGEAEVTLTCLRNHIISHQSQAYDFFEMVVMCLLFQTVGYFRVCCDENNNKKITPFIRKLLLIRSRNNNVLYYFKKMMLVIYIYIYTQCQ